MAERTEDSDGSKGSLVLLLVAVAVVWWAAPADSPAQCTRRETERQVTVQAKVSSLIESVAKEPSVSPARILRELVKGNLRVRIRIGKVTSSSIV